MAAEIAEFSAGRGYRHHFVFVRQTDDDHGVDCDTSLQKLSEKRASVKISHSSHTFWTARI